MSPTAVAPATDGRRLRGDASRRAILDAATTVIADAGVGALTHRAVAEAAGVPLARVSYHYPKVDDLLLAAATTYLADFDDRLRRAVEGALAGDRDLVDACTDVLWDLITDGAGPFLAMVEVRIALARRGRTVDGSGVVGVVQAFGPDTEQAASIVAALFGFAVLAASEPAPVPRAQVRAYVASVLGVAP